MKCCLATNGLMNYIFVDKNTTRLVMIDQNLWLTSKLGFKNHWIFFFRAEESNSLLLSQRRPPILKLRRNSCCKSCKCLNAREAKNLSIWGVKYWLFWCSRLYMSRKNALFYKSVKTRKSCIYSNSFVQSNN